MGACGSHGKRAAASPAAAAGGVEPGRATVRQQGCPAAVASTLATVAERVYREASNGADVSEAVHRVQASQPLAAAISSGDAAATRAALRELLVNQIVRIEILDAGRVLASAGSGAAIAPVRGSIPGTSASFVLSVQADSSYLQVVRQVTGAEVALLGGSPQRRLAGSLPGGSPAIPSTSGTLAIKNKKYEASSLEGSVYPSGRLRVVLLVPHAAIRCPADVTQTQLDTLGQVGERIYEEEAGSSHALATRRRIEADAALQRAVAARDLAATRAAIVGLFAAHIHVVRVRVNVSAPSGAERFFYDLGGPYVLAPVHGTLRSGGKIVGHFSFAIQDDAGYLKLAQRFTGAEVLMRTGEKQVMGTLDPGPARVPDRGHVSYRGDSYQAYSFTGEAFPSGPLRISLLWQGIEG
jgi:hypothetical protein